MNAKSERFEMRLDPEALARIDAWREEQDPVPSRAEAVRSLVEDGLERAGQPVLRDGDKLIVALLCDLLRGLGVESEFDPDFIMAALHGGHLWALGRAYGGLFDVGQAHNKTVAEVIDVLEMWRFLEEGHAALPAAGKAKVALEAGRDSVRFPGFDGNHESRHMDVARFMVDRMDYFPGFAGRGDFNSHWPMLESYRRMLAIFRPMRSALIGREMDAREIAAVLAAGSA